MRPAIPSNANAVFKAPANWDAEKYGPCEDLHVLREDHLITTLWSPSPEDLQILNNGGFLVLSVHGQQLTPLMLSCRSDDTIG